MICEERKEKGKNKYVSLAVEPEREVPFHRSVTCESNTKRVRKGPLSRDKSKPKAGVRESGV
jgi:hypothetical protein